MKYYTLENRITNEKDIDNFMLDKWKLRIESKLIIDNDYCIERVVDGNLLYYVHIKEERTIKICVYEEVTE